VVRVEMRREGQRLGEMRGKGKDELEGRAVGSGKEGRLEMRRKGWTEMRRREEAICM
jgi:hypothetical protein